MKEQLSKIRDEAKNELKKALDSRILEELRVKYLGKKGVVKEVLGKLGEMSEDTRKEIGRFANEIKDEIGKLFEEASLSIEKSLKEAKLRSGVADISIPQSVPPMGFSHPLTLVTEKMVNIFKSMGYAVEDGPELEEEYYNFDALNIPPYHPARDDHDSFYMGKGKLLRTHTSPVQIRTMKNKKPPLAIIVPGRCYRRDASDATHSPTFYQMEGLVVDKGLSFADLKGTLLLWAKMMFGEKTNIRLRPDFFPFTEPSAELAVTCPVCHGPGCGVCKHTGWVELMGCGMVNPVVLENCGIDSEVYSGFAFGMGIERVAMVVYGIKDIRFFYENDLRLLEQFVK
jgi:phenylalanyl-tRNA synthetase alpha chain